MYRKIVVGFDGSDAARDALALAGVLRAADGHVIAACVHPSAHFPHGAKWQSAMRARAQESADLALDEPGADPSWLEPRAAAGGSAAHGIHDLAADSGADLVVVGSSRAAGRGRTLAGGVAQRLLNGAPCPVAVAPSGFRVDASEPRVVALAIDGSPESEIAMVEGAALALSFAAAVRLLSVVPPVDNWVATAAPANPQEIERYQRQYLKHMLDEAAERLPAELRPAPLLLEGRAAEALVAEAERGVHLLVMGSRGYGPLARTLLGSTAADVMRDAPCSVLVVPRGAAAPNVGAGEVTAVELAPEATRTP